MASSRMLLLKLKTSPKLPMRFLFSPTLVPIGPVSPITRSAFKAPTFALQGMTQNLFARGMGTGRSSSMPRGSSRKDEEEEEEDFDDDAENWEDVDDDDCEGFDEINDVDELSGFEDNDEK